MRPAGVPPSGAEYATSGTPVAGPRKRGTASQDLQAEMVTPRKLTALGAVHRRAASPGHLRREAPPAPRGFLHKPLIRIRLPRKSWHH